jgi:lipoprotein-releasing system ATP-binding protein
MTDASGAETVLRGEGLVKSYPGAAASAPSTSVLRGVSLALRPGESVAVLGPSGAGKTTLLYLLGGLARPSAGKVSLGGQDLYSLPDEALSRLRNRRLGFIFQFHHLLPELTAEENVALPRMMSGLKTIQAQAEARTLLKEVGLGHRLSHKPGELSGGEQQRVAIARALVNRPEVVLADEPTGNLDKNTAASVHEILLSSAKARGQALVLVTHNEALAARAQRTVYMEDGKIVKG